MLPEALILIHDSTDLGGAELHLINILQASKSLGIRNYLITQSKGSIFDRFEHLVEDYCITPIPRPRKLKSIATLYPFKKTCRSFMQTISAKNRCILVGDLYPLWASLKLDKISKTPVYSLWQGEYAFDSKGCVQKWIRYGANKADKLFANSFIKKHAEAQSILNKKIFSLNPSVDIDKFSRKNYNREALRKHFQWDDHKIAVCVGRYGEGKGQPWLIDHFLNDNRLNSEWKLVIAGPIEAQDLKHIQSRLKREDINHSIQILGQRTDIPELYAVSDLALFPGTVRESFGLSMIEAGLMEVPVIALKQGALPFIFGQTYSGLIPPNERNSIINLIRNFDSNTGQTLCNQLQDVRAKIISSSLDLKRELIHGLES